MTAAAEGQTGLLSGVIADTEAWLIEVWALFSDSFLETERLFELAIIIASLGLGYLVTNFLIRILSVALKDRTWWSKLPPRMVRSVLWGSVSLILLFSGQLALTDLLDSLYLIPLAISLMSAWVVIRLLVSPIRNRELARMAAVMIWSIAALNIFGVLGLILSVLDGARLPLGDADISVLQIGMGLITIILSVWLALVAAKLIEARVRDSGTVPPAAKELISKTVRFALLVLAILLSLTATGIDLTALAVFGGALGVGIGFGLQKVVGNFISGLILLLDRSIKPGDVIETGGTYGRINKMAARYTSVITRDGTEFLIPNENMITEHVVNWSHTDRLVRRRIPVQVAYGTDLDQATALMNESASEEDRVLSDPAPRTLIRGFGSDGIDLELRMWIKDPQNGVSNIASAVMYRIWKKFTDTGIEFPFPQRVVHLKNETETSAAKDNQDNSAS